MKPFKYKNKAFISWEWVTAARYLRSNSKELGVSIIAIFSFLGIMLGVAALIIVMSVMNGFRSEIFSGILGFKGHVIVQYNKNFDKDGYIKDYEKISKAIAKLDGVINVVPFIEEYALASKGRTSIPTIIKAVNEGSVVDIKGVGDSIFFGSIEKFNEDNPGIIIGKRAAENYGVTLGDKLTLTFKSKDPNPPLGLPLVQRVPLEIKAIFDSGIYEYDHKFIFMPLKLAQKLFYYEDGVTAIQINIKNANDVLTSPEGKVVNPAVSDLIDGLQLYALTWKETERFLHDALQMERSAMFVILSLIIIVAALNIISGLTVSVIVKNRDIAILRTIGATKGAIMRIFLLTGFAIGFLGTLCGFILGVLFCVYIENIRQGISKLIEMELFPPEIYHLSRLPADINNYEVMSVVVFALIVSFMAPLYPSWRASRCDPVTTLRYE